MDAADDDEEVKLIMDDSHNIIRPTQWDRDHIPMRPLANIPAPQCPPIKPMRWPLIPIDAEWTKDGMGITGYKHKTTGQKRALDDPPFEKPEYPWEQSGLVKTGVNYPSVAPYYFNHATRACQWDFPHALQSFDYENIKYVKPPQHVRAIKAPETSNRWGITKKEPLKRSLSSAFTRKMGGRKHKRDKRCDTKRRKRRKL
jgi:hypothetical protein